MTSDERLLHLLRQVHCFSGLDDNKLRLLREGMQLEVFEPGAIICREGESGDRMFVIESGEVAVLKAGEAGATIEITVLQAGEIAGELSLFGEGIRSATLQARTRAALWVLKHDDFEGLVEAHGELATGLFATLSRHLSRQNSVMARLLSRDIDPRLKIAFFDTKPYMQTAFAEANRYDYAITFYEPRLSEETVSMAAGFPVVCVFVNDSLTASAVDELAALGVEMIALRCAGYNNVDLAACERNGVSVARVPAYSPFAVAEHAVSLMMTLNRRVHRAYNRVRDGNFSLRGLVGFDMHGKTAGIVGAGQIGRCVLRILAGFGCRLLVHTRTPDPALTDELGVTFVELDDLFRESDIVSLHAPLMPATHHLIDSAAVAKMKRGVMLINTGRGALIDTAALLEGLKSGHIGYAGLDVYEEESGYFFEDFSDRVMTDDLLARLTTFSNVVVTSHQAFLTREALGNISATTLANIREYETGKRMGDLTNAVRPRGKP